MLQQQAAPPHPLSAAIIVQEPVKVAPLPVGFVYLDEALSQIPYDAAYATERNFTGAVVPGYEANRIALSEAMVEPLRKASERAAELGYALLVWDAARPMRAVDAFVAWAKRPEEEGPAKAAHYPNVARADMFALGYIAARSGHSRGAAIDLTLADPQGFELMDMGTIFDFMDPLARHGAEGLSAAQAENRETLATIMESCGFVRYEGEWWHYRLAREPFPDKFFDFVIG